jgi:hypothetical protein
MNKMPRGPPQSDVEMQRMESVHKVGATGSLSSQGALAPLQGW